MQKLGNVQDSGQQQTILTAIRTALRGRRRVATPAGWTAVYDRLANAAEASVRRQAEALGVVLGDPRALEKMRAVARSTTAPGERRRQAIDSLLAAGDPELPPLLLASLEDPAVRTIALRGLAQVQVPAAAAKVLAMYDRLSPADRRLAMASLTARAETGLAVLEAIEEGKLPANALSADLVRQLHFLEHPRIDQLLQEVWGTVRATPQERIDLIARYQSLVEGADGPDPDLSLGRQIYSQTCQQCHQLYGEGGKVGPDLTGSNRHDLQYLLSNIVDPSAVMAKEYQPTVVLTVDGRVITGLLRGEDAQSLTLQTADAEVIVPKDEIETRQQSPQSMMPDDQLKPFNDHQIRSLIAYLRSKRQVPLPAQPGK